MRGGCHTSTWSSFVGRAEIRAAIERLRALWEYFVQNVHAGVVTIDGDTATGRAYIVEFGRFTDGTSHLNYALYHDRYQRTPDGWQFAERVYEVRYVDSTPLTGMVPPPSVNLAEGFARQYLDGPDPSIPT